MGYTPCESLEALAESAERGTAIRIAVGVSGNITNPTTLRHLHLFADLRIAPVSLQPGIFHPKYFRFRGHVLWKTIRASQLKDHQKRHENELLHRLREVVPEGVREMDPRRSMVRLREVERDATCPLCGREGVITSWKDHTFSYGSGESQVELTVSVPVRRCDACEFEYLDESAERLKHDAVCDHLGVLSPIEIRLRKAA